MKRTLIFFGLLVLTSCGGTASRTSNADHASHAPSINNSSNTAPSDHNTMDHSTMKSSPGASSAPFELQFLDSMIVHHKGAVEMAMLAEGRAERAEVKELAANIIHEQEREIAKMSEWRDRWFEGKAEAVNMEFRGMSHGMRGMDMKKLAALRGKEFDAEFVRQMIPHHEGAVEMAKAIKASDSYAELKELADDIITTQEAEIKQMREWQSN